jgi:hypothetical protein
MMENLLKRGEAIAAAGQQRTLQDVAGGLRAMFGNSAVQADDAQVLVTGRGILKRWLIDPNLRFLTGGPR